MSAYPTSHNTSYHPDGWIASANSIDADVAIYDLRTYDPASPPATNLAKQQRKLNPFQQRYNHERPHEALSGDFPAERWQPSSKEYPSRLPQPEYPGHFEVRRVSTCGTFRLKVNTS